MSAAAVAGILLAHLVGDYLVQSHWMAAEKTKRWWPAIAHGLTYTLPYVAVTRTPIALAITCGTHIVIDHWRLARYVVWAKNLIAPRGFNPPWRECSATGYPPDVPAWLAAWLMILADNTLHLLINFAAIALAG